MTRYIRYPAIKVRGLIFIIWHSRHEFYHVLLGLAWAWFLRERWDEYNLKWIWTSIIGSLLPDIDHFFYFITYGRRASYTQQIKHMLKTKQWRNLTVFIENGHKTNTSLSSHNIYFMAILFAVAIVSSMIEWEIGVVLFGAMFIHYVFDIFDDIFQLGELNPNWKRWGRSH